MEKLRLNNFSTVQQSKIVTKRSKAATKVWKLIKKLCN